MKLGQVIICSNLALLGPKIPCFSILSITYLHLPLFTYIWPNVALIALILLYVPYSPQIDILLLRLHLCKVRVIGQLFMDIAFKRIGGYRKCCHECSLCVYLVIANSDALPLYPILKQSDNWLCIYCISKIWGIQQASSRMQLF